MTPPEPRYNQIDELTRGLDLPFVALQDEHLWVVAEVLETAWLDLSRTQPATLLSGSEAEVNALMETRLGQLLDEYSLWDQMVRCITRGKETLSFDGTHLEKRPDLSIHLTSRNQAFPLIVECKLIDAANRKGVDLYCENGLRRFLIGEYGWATREAFMLAYVRDSSSIASTLTPLLATSQSGTRKSYLIEELPTAMRMDAPHLARSRHGRLFRYPSRVPPGDDPGSIAVWHLWVAASDLSGQCVTHRSARFAGV